jgi:ATP-dependent DNA ligase
MIAVRIGPDISMAVVGAPSYFRKRAEPKRPQDLIGHNCINLKHDGFRVIARKEGKRVKLYSRPGNDLTDRFPLIVEAMAKLRSQSSIV